MRKPKITREMIESWSKTCTVLECGKMKQFYNGKNLVCDWFDCEKMSFAPYSEEQEEVSMKYIEQITKDVSIENFVKDNFSYSEKNKVAHLKNRMNF